MKKILTQLCYAICAVMMLLHLDSCHDPTIVDKGNTLDFQSFNLQHVDTCSVIFNTVPDRPLISSGVSSGVLGSSNDLFFGNTFAGIYAQCLLLALPPSFVGAVVDSAVLVMPYVSVTSKYGYCNKPIDLVVYQVNQNMIPGTNYYTDDAFSVINTPIGIRNNFVADLVDSVHFIDPVLTGGIDVPYDAQQPMVRIRLNNAFANSLLNAPDTTLLASSTFLEYLNGLYITTTPSKVGNGLMYVNLNSSAINLYYHHPSYTPIDTSVFQFNMSTYGVTLNHFDHYYGGTLVQQTMSNPNPNGDKVGYIQAGGGVRLKLTLPYLKNLPPNIGVTKAELVMPILDTLLGDPSYPPPPSLTMSRIDDTLNVDPLNDNQYSSVTGSSGSGILTTRVDNNGLNFQCYVFDITLYVQRVLNGYYSNNNGYYITFSSNVRGDRAVILNDKSNPKLLSRQCKLNITYTKLQ